jgi:hypothetical protein
MYTAPVRCGIMCVCAGSLASGDGLVAGRSLDEWKERLFPDVSIRVTDDFDEDSPYSRNLQVDSHSLAKPLPNVFNQYLGQHYKAPSPTSDLMSVHTSQQTKTSAQLPPPPLDCREI